MLRPKKHRVRPPLRFLLIWEKNERRRTRFLKPVFPMRKESEVKEGRTKEEGYEEEEDNEEEEKMKGMSMREQKRRREVYEIQSPLPLPLPLLLPKPRPPRRASDACVVEMLHTAAARLGFPTAAARLYRLAVFTSIVPRKL
ncbi:uncharacterized protein K452DRAFT_77366 [Aplosporella prunicola CBS 121167]|uniref:Uncharacterized protein n=1 Tax=Aplosporella prunicola CBS 121167 TaxID=1176127 RepID=A0A6A6B5M7_9PEZI|nr:uncharacterized protein K452DRAFT_77366 [Aplosporella prunicola CBS 121167]KAF2139429.1 hypothetical protein K452DRAFT_77366 [Aplosporella prunicola CBS 121167]